MLTPDSDTKVENPTTKLNYKTMSINASIGRRNGGEHQLFTSEQRSTLIGQNIYGSSSTFKRLIARPRNFHLHRHQVAETNKEKIENREQQKVNNNIPRLSPYTKEG